MMPLPFAKLQGAGNDFIFIDLRSNSLTTFTTLSRENVVEKLANRHFGIGADGVVFVEAFTESPVASEAAFKWDFYNSDGSHAEMCGNAARCMGRWAQNFAAVSKFNLKTAAGIVAVEVHGADVSVRIDIANVPLREIKLRTQPAKRAVLLNTGVPHAVVEVEDIAKARESLDIVRELRFHAEAGERGTNVTFLEKKTVQSFSTITFERGIEDFTLACGTGVLAAAIVGLKNSTFSEASIETPGGKLRVRLDAKGGAELLGPADIVFTGSIKI